MGEHHNLGSLGTAYGTEMERIDDRIWIKMTDADNSTLVQWSMPIGEAYQFASSLTLLCAFTHPPEKQP